MAGYPSLIPQIGQSQGSKEVTANIDLNAASPAMIFGIAGYSALTLNLIGGCIPVSGVPTQIANQTVALTASATNYVKASSAGVVSVVTSIPASWPGPLAAGAIALYTIITGPSTISSVAGSIVEHRTVGTATSAAAGALLIANNLSDVASASASRTSLGLAAIAASGSASDLSAGTVPAARMPALTGDVTTSAGAVATTLATVNGNVGTFGDGTHVAAVTVNAKGLTTAVSSVLITGAAPSGSAGGDLTGTYPNPTVDANKITLAKMATVATATVLGRNTAGTGNVEALTTIPTSTVPAFTGDVTNSAGSLATTIANDAVTNAKLANMANATIKGRTTAGTGDPEDLTATQATALLNNVVGDSGSGGTKGLVPAPSSGDAAGGKFLKADGTWTAPSSGGGWVLLESHTASSSAQLDFTSWYSSSYDVYVIEVLDLMPASNTVNLFMRMSTDGGSTYDSTSNIYAHSLLESSSSGTGVSGSTGNLITVMHNLINTGSQYNAGEYRLWNPGSTAFTKRLNGQATVSTGGPPETQILSSIYGVTTPAVNAFRFAMSSGNITSGTIRIYGVTK